MFNLFRFIFGDKRPIIDRIVEFTDPDSLYIWNGIDKNDPSKYMIPMSSRKHYDWSAPNFQWLMIGFGHYNDQPIIEIWINRKMEIVRCSLNHPEYAQKDRKTRRFEKKIDKLYDRLCDTHFFKTNNDEMIRWIEYLFGARPENLYRKCVDCVAFTTTNRNRLYFTLD